MHVLRELGIADVASVRLLSVVKTQVCFEVGGRGEALVADVATMRAFPGVNEVMLLEMGQLCELFRADVTFEWTLARVRSEYEKFQ